MPDRPAPPASAAPSPPRFLLRGTRAWQALAFDAALAPLTACASLLRAPPVFDPAAAGRVLVLRLDHLGDVVMTTALLRTLHRLLPRARVEAMVKPHCAPLLKHLPFVHRVHAYAAPWTRRAWEAGARSEWPEGPYDLILSCRGDFRENALAWRIGAPVRVGFDARGGGGFLTHIVPYALDRHQTGRDRLLLETLGLPADPQTPQLVVTREETEAARAFLHHHGIGGEERFVALCPVAASPLKNWAWERFRAVGERLRANDIPVVALLPPERPEAERFFAAAGGIVVPPPVGVRELVALLRLARVCVCNDSGPMHMACAAGTEGVAVFGPTCEDLTGPPPGKADVLAAAPSLRPRWLPGTPPPPAAACRAALEAVTVEEVVTACQRRLDAG